MKAARSLKGEVAVVTGAASGIGRELARRLARDGVALAIADKDTAGLAETAKMVASSGVAVSTHVFDVADASRLARFPTEVLERHGRVSILINNAGAAILGTVEQLSLDDYEWLININFWGVVRSVKHFLPHLKKEPRAAIVNLSSIFGIIAPPGQSAYCASKFAVRGFTESLRHEMQGQPILIMSVHPGGIRTAIARNARIGAGVDPATAQEMAAAFDKLAPTLPEAAAERIVRGIVRGDTRVLIGADAKQLDWIQRYFPERHWRIIGPIMTRRAGRALF
jgi:NAD(P)-dependent dehydrogenase (short-subunit alcohol dehydrogenase family)